MENLCTIWRIDTVRTTAYYPEANGASEGLNQTSKGWLQKMRNVKSLEEWNVELSEVMFAYNTRVQSTTGFTPYFLMYGVDARVPSEILVGLPEMERTPAGYAFHRYQKLDVAYEAVRESAYTKAKRAKDYYDLGAIQKQFNVGDNVLIGIAPLNRRATNLHWNWSKLYQLMAGKGVIARGEDPDTKESLTVHVDRLAFSSPRLRDELDPNVLFLLMFLLVPFGILPCNSCLVKAQ